MTTKKIAAEFAPGSGMVQLIDKGVIMERADAEALSYTVSASIAPTAPAPSTNTAPANGAESLSQWRSAIIKSPEANGRDGATAELLTKHSPDTLSVDDARSFLRGLPNERSEPKAPNVTKTDTDPRAARKAEIAISMAAFNANRGYAARQAPASGAPALAGIEPAKLKRLAELRMAALEAGPARADGEAKKLRYALQVHDQTGLPLAQVFSQLGVDTSKFAR